MADVLGEKTEKPTPKRLKDARKRGQVATSRDLSMAAGSLAATGALVAVGSYIMHRLMDSVINGLTRFGDTPLRTVTTQDLSPLVISGAALVAMTVGPVAVAAAAIGVLTAAVQSGFNVSAESLHINWKRLSPSSGLKKLAPSKAGVDTLKALLTCGVLGVLAWRIGKDLAADSVRLSWTSPIVSADRGWTEALRLLWQAGFALLAFGSLDYGVQRWRHVSSLKMTKQEVKDEAKTSEANPAIRARVRRIQRDMARRRMLKAVPTATVVLTNPTHFAVALEYKRENGGAPVVVAKGQDLIAARIRDIARKHAVPIVENPPLTRALFQECEIGDTIPGPLFGAVAEVLAYLIRIKQLVL